MRPALAILCAATTLLVSGCTHYWAYQNGVSYETQRDSDNQSIKESQELSRMPLNDRVDLNVREWRRYNDFFLSGGMLETLGKCRKNTFGYEFIIQLKLFTLFIYGLYSLNREFCVAGAGATLWSLLGWTLEFTV